MEELKFSIMSNDVRIVPDVVEKKVSGKDYVFYGEENKFPQYVWNLYLKSAILQGIVNGTCDFVSGNGIISNLPIAAMNSDGDELEDLIRKISMDYNIFGGFCFQVIKDYTGTIKELYWLDMQNIRLNEEGDKAYYCEKWNQYGAKAVEYEVWNPRKNQSNFVVYYKGHISRGLYPVPRFIGALAAIETSTEIGKFHLNNILNNLTSSAIINFNNGEPSEEQKKMIEKKLNDKFSGANNAGKNMIVFNNSKEEAVTIERLGEDNFDKKFETLSKSTREEIFISFRATPALFGLNPENNGFSKAEFLESFELYNKCVVKPIQNDIKRVFDKLFNMENSIQFKTFTLEDGENKAIE